MLIEANGIAIHCEVEGPARELGVVMLSHSLATNLTMWDPQVPALSHRYRVLRYDIRGHGGSEVPEGPYTLESLVHDARDLLLVLDIPRVHFVGISLGGMIGQLLAATCPEMLSSLVLCDTSCRTSEEARSLWDERISLAEIAGMEPHVDSTVSRWFTPEFILARPEIVDPVRRMIRDTNPRGYVGCAHVVRTLDVEDMLPKIQARTLVMAGDRDPGSPPEVARNIRAKIRVAELVVLPSASHLSNLEQPEAFNGALMDFLRRVDADGQSARLIA